SVIFVILAVNCIIGPVASQIRAKILVYSLLLLLPLGMALAAEQKSAQSDLSNVNPNANLKIEQLEHTLFWLGILCGIGLMLPLPICLYHFRRVGRLLAEINR